MQDSSAAHPVRKRSKLWLILPAAILGCGVVAAVVAFLALPAIRKGWPAALEAATAESANAGISTSAAPPTGSSDSSSASEGPVDGGRGDPLLKTDVWKSITGFYASDRSCTDVSSTMIEITQNPDSSGVWEELWTLQACGDTAALKVKFTPSPQGGTDYHISQ